MIPTSERLADLNRGDLDFPARPRQRIPLIRRHITEQQLQNAVAALIEARHDGQEAQVRAVLRAAGLEVEGEDR